MLETDVYFFHWVMVGGEGKIVCVWMGVGWGVEICHRLVSGMGLQPYNVCLKTPRWEP